MGRCAQHMKHRNAQKISSKSLPNSSPRLSPNHQNLSPRVRSGECPLSFFSLVFWVFIKENLIITKDFLSQPNPQNPWKRQRKHQNDERKLLASNIPRKSKKPRKRRTGFCGPSIYEEQFRKGPQHNPALSGKRLELLNPSDKNRQPAGPLKFCISLAHRNSTAISLWGMSGVSLFRVIWFCRGAAMRMSEDDLMKQNTFVKANNSLE